MKYIYQHLGLGDHIICNGLIRNIINKNEKYTLFVKPNNFVSVSFMFRDIKNLKFIQGDDSFVNNFSYGINDVVLMVGFGAKEGLSWDEFFYYLYNVDFNKRWSDFKVLRNYNREKKLFSKLNPQREPYILIHSKGSDGVDRINYSIIPNNIKKIFVEKHTDNIFDYLGLIEGAQEIHCVESSFNVLVDSLILPNKLFFHTLNNGRGFSHKLKNDWQIV